MVRAGGLSLHDRCRPIRPAAHLRHDASCAPASRSRPAPAYTVAGWACVNEGTEGPPVWDVVAAHIKAKGTVNPTPAQVTVRGA